MCYVHTTQLAEYYSNFLNLITVIQTIQIQTQSLSLTTKQTQNNLLTVIQTIHIQTQLLSLTRNIKSSTQKALHKTEHTINKKNSDKLNIKLQKNYKNTNPKPHPTKTPKKKT